MRAQRLTAAVASPLDFWKTNMASAAGRSNEIASEPSAKSVVESSAARQQWLEYLVPATLGTVLWSVVCLGPLEIELGASSARTPYVLLYLQPLLLLAIGVLTRRTIISLVAFPVSLAACFFVLQPLDLRPLSTLQGALTLMLALTAFVAGTARVAGGSGATRRLRGEKLMSGVSPGYRPLALYAWPRLVLLAAVFIIPLFALYGPEGQASLTENFPDRRADAMVLIHTVHLFLTILVAYLFFLSPAVNFALEVSELRRSLRALKERKRLRSRWRNLIIYVALGILLAAFLLLRARAIS